MPQIFRDLMAKEEYRDWERSVGYLYEMVESLIVRYDYANVRVLPSVACSIDWTANSKPWASSFVLGMKGNVSDPGSVEKIGVQVKEEQVSTEILSSFALNESIVKVKTMPQHPSVVASLSMSGEVSVADMNTNNQPNRLQHPSHGLAIEWCPQREGTLVCGTEDGQLCLWSEVSQSVQSCPLTNSPINDISWNFAQDSVLGVAYQKGVGIYDTRQESFAQEIPFPSPCSLLRFNPLTTHVFLSVSEDNVVSLWDLRYTKHFAHQLEDHGDAVTCAAWSPHAATTLATGGDDMKVRLWDLMKIGNEQTAEEAEDGPAELVFTHQGHTERVRDVRWSAEEEGMVASVGEDCTLQVWKMKAGLYKDDELDVGMLE